MRDREGAWTSAVLVPRPSKASMTAPNATTSEAVPTCSLVKKRSTSRIVAKSVILAMIIAPPSQLKPRCRCCCACTLESTRIEQGLGFIQTRRIIHVEPEPILDVEHPSLNLVRKHLHGSGNAVVSRILAQLERVEHGRRTQKNTRIDGIELTDDLADVYDPAVRTQNPRDVLRIIDRPGHVEVHGERDRIRFKPRCHQFSQYGRVDQVIAHGQHKGTVQKGSGLRDR